LATSVRTVRDMLSYARLFL